MGLDRNEYHTLSRLSRHIKFHGSHANDAMGFVEMGSGRGAHPVDGPTTRHHVETRTGTEYTQGILPS